MGCCKDATGSRVRQFLLYEMVLALGLAAPGDCDRALIFDGRVAATIKKLGQPWVLDGRNNADRYASYVSLANSVAKWSSYCCGDPERVEYSLYWMG